MWRMDRFGVNMTSKAILEKIDPYTNCNKCHMVLPHCHCMCPYCGKRDECECVLFDAVTGG
jgi:hypothetical protein